MLIYYEIRSVGYPRHSQYPVLKHTEYILLRHSDTLIHTHIKQVDPGYLPDMTLGYGLDDRRFESRQGLGTFLFTTVSRPALEPNHLLSNGYQGLFTWV
jgi:hypothetical protein